MSVNYNFEIVSLETNENNIVEKANARYWAEQDGVVDVKPMSVLFVDVDPNGKVPYAELTEELVKGC